MLFRSSPSSATPIPPILLLGLTLISKKSLRLWHALDSSAHRNEVRGGYRTTPSQRRFLQESNHACIIPNDSRFLAVHDSRLLRLRFPRHLPIARRILLPRNVHRADTSLWPVHRSSSRADASTGLINQASLDATQWHALNLVQITPAKMRKRHELDLAAIHAV